LRKRIFYGAGSYAVANLAFWKERGVFPECFADADKSKWNTELFGFSLSEGVDILPLKDAIERCGGNYEIYVTVLPDYWDDVFDFLVNKGISRELIRFPEMQSVGVSKHCTQLGNYLVLTKADCDTLVVMTCCYHGKRRFVSSGDFEKDYAKWRVMTSKLVDDLEHGLGSTCIGCPQLKDGVAQSKPQLRRINLSTGIPGGEYCNLRCCYCTYLDMLSNPKNVGGYSVLDVLSWIVNNIDDAGSIYIDYAAGEITISPYRNEMLGLWKKLNWQGTILTNCVIYNQDIADLLHSGKVVLNCSLDAGTRSTYAKIKGVDCFDTTISNLRKYAVSGGAIKLKYILLRGLNDNEADVSGFFEIAKEIGAEVILSWDSNDCLRDASETERDMAQRLVALCKEFDVPFIYTDSILNIHDLVDVNDFAQVR